MCDGRPERRLGELARLTDIECEEGPLGAFFRLHPGECRAR